MRLSNWLWLMSFSALILLTLSQPVNFPATTTRTHTAFRSIAEPVDQARWNFALRIWRQSGPTNLNTVIAPAFTALLVAIAQIGSTGDTYNEFMESLKYPGTSGGNVTDEELLASWKDEFDDMLKCLPNSLYCINVVHLLTNNSEITLKDSYIEKLNEFLNGKLKVESYDDYWERTMEDDYQQLQNDSHNIVGQMSFSSNSFTFLINASFYDQPWKSPFKPEKTIDRDFGADREMVIKLPFMPGEVFTSYFFGDNEDVQILGIPFADNATCMYMFLPLNKFGLAKFELESEGDRLLQMILKLRSADVEVEILKFEMESSIKMLSAFKRLGFLKATGPEADFSKMTDSKIYIENVTHNSFIKVDEDGFKSKELRQTIIRPEPKVLWQGPHYRFVSYHPFLYIIARNQKLFYIGRYV